MSRFLPTTKGGVTLILAFFSCMLLPALRPAHRSGDHPGPIPTETWVIVIAAVTICIVLGIFALLRGSFGDRIAVGMAALFVIWLIVIFARAAQPNNALEPTPVGAFGSAFAVDIIGPAWLSLGR